MPQFLYEMMCRHGCFSVQINDQDREFVNEISAELHTKTGVKQRITSAYHPQSNGLVERQNRTIKNCLVKVCNENPATWPRIIDGILFAHRVSRHSSTRYTPFFLLYNREPTLPIDVKHNLVKENDLDEPFDKETFDAVLASATRIRQDIHNDAFININKAQKKQKKMISIDVIFPLAVLNSMTMCCSETTNETIERGVSFLTFGLDRILWKILPQKGWLP